jgi:DNA-binding transcriptional MerR regulator
VGNLEEEQEFYKMEDVTRITGLSEHTIRTWQREFNIQIDKTDGGHRRFTEKDIQLFKSIDEKKKANGWSTKQIRNWLNGELTPEIIQDTQVKTNLEKDIQEFKQEITDEFKDLKDVVLQQSQIIMALTQKLDEKDKNQDKLIEDVIKRLSDPVENRAVSIATSLIESLEKRQAEVAAAEEKKETEHELHKQKEKLGPISRLFSKIGL